MGIVLTVVFLGSVAWILYELQLCGCLYWACWMAYGVLIGGAVIAFVSGVFRV